ncbi:MAG: DUF2194 domain-containing protein [Lachnospiraceae bacterium]|nr:DUF2194 domain-containing protein [Lachnospiraceae bacterium]
MVSRRNFFSIVVMMAVLLFMFQFSQVIKENESDYHINVYAMEEIVPNTPIWRAESQEGNAPGHREQDGMGGEVQFAASDGAYAAFFGSKKGKVYPVVEQWCVYNKQGLVVYHEPGDYTTERDNLPEVFLVDTTSINLLEHVAFFSELTELGIPLVFCNLPQGAEVRKSEDLCALLGIGEVVSEQIEVEGIHLFSGFLLGGGIKYVAVREEEKKNQDMNLQIPWYMTKGGTKTYMVGILDELLEEEEAKNEYFPPLIWRNSFGNAKVFVVNGEYLSDMTGVGILDAMMYEAASYVIYPIINAQNVLVTNYPEFAGENDEIMMELYSRKMEAVQRDIFWPDLAALIERNQLKLTCLFAPQYEYLDETEPSGETVPFYLQQLKETGAEAGMSLTYGEGISLQDKLSRDQQFYASQENPYQYAAAFAEQEDIEQMGGVLTKGALLKDIRTLASDFPVSQPVISWYESGMDGAENYGITLQNVTSDVKTHTFSNDLFVRSMETALGYSNVRIDMHDVLWPQSEADQWEKMYDSMSSNLNTYWKAFSSFDQTTLTESDGRVRAFLNLDYRDRREEDCIYLETFGAAESWFLLRIHGEEIASITGAAYRKIEEGTYLLHVTEGAAEIGLRRNRGLLEYTYP